MRLSKRSGWILCCLFLFSSLALAAKKTWTGFNERSSRGTDLGAGYNGFHFNDKSDSNVGWMHLISLKDGGWITLLYTVSNLGPYKKTTSIAALYLNKDGRKYRCDAQWRDSDYFTPPPADKYWIGVSKSFFGGKYPNFEARLDDAGCKGEIKFKATLPSYNQGTGVATFFEDKSAMWRLTQIAPRATAKGYLQFKEERINVEGAAYLEEMSTDLAIPDMSDRWYILRAELGPYTVNLFDNVLDKRRFGKGHIRSLLVAKDNKIIVGTSRFQYNPIGGRVDPESKNHVPESFQLIARDRGTLVQGTVKVGQILDSLDVLSQAPTFIRIAGGLLHGTPWQYRAASELDLTVTKGDSVQHIKGTAYQEIHFYDR